MIANIEVTQHTLALGRRYHTFKWIGPKTGIVAIGREFREDFDLNKLPWKLKFIKEIWERDSYLYARCDNLFIVSWALQFFNVFLRQKLMWIKSRLILTLMVWGLAYVPQYEPPSWKHIGKRLT